MQKSYEVRQSSAFTSKSRVIKYCQVTRTGKYVCEIQYDHPCSQLSYDPVFDCSHPKPKTWTTWQRWMRTDEGTEQYIIQVHNMSSSHQFMHQWDPIVVWLIRSLNATSDEVIEHVGTLEDVCKRDVFMSEGTTSIHPSSLQVISSSHLHNRFSWFFFFGWSSMFWK